MKRKNQFTFQEKGVVIKFTPCPQTEEEPLQRYSFAVEGNNTLTQKLIRSGNQMVKKSILECAKALFKMIKNK